MVIYGRSQAQLSLVNRSAISQTGMPHVFCSFHLSFNEAPAGKMQGKMLPTTLSMIVVSIIGFRRKSQRLGLSRMSKA